MKSLCLRTLALVPGVLLLAALPAGAQVGTGEIFGKVVDATGAATPGAMVTLESEALIQPLSVTAASTGAYRFPSLPVGVYTVKFEMAGFARLIKQGVHIEAGFNAEINAQLKLSNLEETLTVSGEGPIVDTRSTTLATAFNREMLEKIPSARDPWVILEQTPGMVMDRQNVGGNQSGQQSAFINHGAAVNQGWNLDGASITDMAADASPTYYDFDSFQEIQITTAGADASQDVGGVSINFVTKSGGNQFHGSGRLFVTDHALESNNVTPDLLAQGAGSGNPIRDIKDYGFELGGPIVKNKAWFWGSYARNPIDVGVVGFLKPGCTDPNNNDCLQTDHTLLDNYNVKLNYQWSKEHKSSFLWQGGNKIRDSRGAGNLRPIETTQRQSAPVNFFLLQHQWLATSKLVLEAKATSADAGFLLDYHADNLAAIQPTFDIVTQMNGRSGSYQNNIRPIKEARLDGTYLLDGFLGGDHSLKFGVRGRWTPYETMDRTGGGAVARYNNGVPAEANIVRDGDVSRDLYEYSAYVNNSMRRRRLTVNLGLRYDYQKDKAKAATIGANPILPDLLPAVDFKGADSGAHFGDFSPRFGLTYDLRGNGRTVLKATAARYYGLGIFTAGNLSPTGQTTLRYPWKDLNNDGVVQRNELDLTRLLTFSNNYDPKSPSSVKSAISVDPNLSNDITNELLAGIEHELGHGFGVGVTYIWRHYYNYNDTFRVGLSSADYRPVAFTAACGNTTCDQPSYTVTYWQLPSQIPAASIQRNTQGGRHYQGVELVARRRFNGKWMVNGSLTLQHYVYRYDGGPNVDYQDPTNVAQQDNQLVGTQNVAWVGKLSGAYTLPAGFQLSAFLNTRQGFPFNRQILTPTRTGSIGTASVFVYPYGTERYPAFKEVDAALEKTFIAGKTRITASAAAFNLFNSNVVLGLISRQNASNANSVTTILAPRVIRMGVRFNF
jgi:hypothetical protein